MLAKRMRWVLRAAAAISRFGEGTGAGRQQMVLEEPDLIDADAVGKLNFVKLAAEHFRVASSFRAAWWSTRWRAAWPYLPALRGSMPHLAPCSSRQSTPSTTRHIPSVQDLPERF